MSEQVQGVAAPQPAEVNNNSESNENQENNAAPVVAAPEEVKAEIKRLKKLKIKVDNREFDEDLPFEIDDTPEAIEYMTKNLQMSKVAQKRMSEKAQLDKEVQSFLQELKKNPRRILSDPNIGIDVKKLAAEIIEEEIANAQKSPEQLEKEKLQAELAELKEKNKKDSEEFQKKEMERLQELEYARYDNMVSEALEKSDLPKSPYIVKKIGNLMLMGLEEGLEVTPADVLPLVREEMHNDLKEMFAVMPEDVIEQLIGKDVLTKIRKKNLAKAKAKPPAPLNSAIKDTATPKQEKDGKDVKKQSFKDFFGV